MASGSLPRPRELLLTPKNAARLAERLSDLRGAAMKVGQLLSMEAGDLLPPELSAVLARLREDAHRMPLGHEGPDRIFPCRALGRKLATGIHRG